MKKKKLNTKARKTSVIYQIRPEVLLIDVERTTIYGGKTRVIPGIPKKLPKDYLYVTLNT